MDTHSDSFPLEPLYDQFEVAIAAGETPHIEDVLTQLPSDLKTQALYELLQVELWWRHSRDELPTPAEYEERFPQHRETVHSAFKTHNRHLSFSRSPANPDSLTGPSSEMEAGFLVPDRVGRYVVEKLLGSGSFGHVLLGLDEQLQRRVAIKIPNSRREESEPHHNLFEDEARTVAELDHPGIVPVYDVGTASDGRLYVVSKYIDGQSLSTYLKARRPKHDTTARLAASLAEALDYAHSRGLVHRDIKPDNVLLDKQGRAYLCDFGLSLREEQYGLTPILAGTPSYMSPEQARGEGHLVDGRSDIYSLGVVLFEMLTGQRPFSGSLKDLLHQITHDEPPLPRQLDASVSTELERITLKCLSKKPSDRYTTAADLAADLRQHFTMQPGSGGLQERIIPRGLRSFDAHDSDFFLSLLPGVRDRRGLPERVAFWKDRLEETDSSQAFRVGLMYGPSGCGKSSLIKAGILPRLATNVRAVYVEATADGTEERLLAGLRRACPDLPTHLSLTEAVTFVRLGRSTRASRKVILILDQFEQWLHHHPDSRHTQLVDALRQCDGTHVQALIMLRVDFWMAANRFFQTIDIPLVEHVNSQAVDLFEPLHARHVLTEFGRAYGQLPGAERPLPRPHQQFLEEALSGLGTKDLFVPAHLAIFADMMKGRPWDLPTLQAVGGATGLGVNFLDQMFSAPQAPAAYRRFQHEARQVLHALLPPSGDSLTRHVLSVEKLRSAAGLIARQDDFTRLLQILDSELRLITPVRQERTPVRQDDQPPEPVQNDGYQLTHDYLVVPVRTWLSRKRKETCRGRAEITLEERTSLWIARHEPRYLPTLLEYLSIRLFTAKQMWSTGEKALMRRARSFHGLRLGVFAVVICLACVVGYSVRSKARAAGLVRTLLTARTPEIAPILTQLQPLYRFAAQDLHEAFVTSPNISDAKLHAALALYPHTDEPLIYLKDRLLTVSPEQFPHVRDLLAPKASSLVPGYWTLAVSAEADPLRFRAATALAAYDRESPRWGDAELRIFLVSELLKSSPYDVHQWIDSLQPVRHHLVGELKVAFKTNPDAGNAVAIAADALAHYLSDSPEQLLDLLFTAPHQPFARLMTAIQPYHTEAVSYATTELNKKVAADATEREKETVAMRQVNAAIMLLKINAADSVWPLFRHTRDPRVRSYLIDRIGTSAATDFQTLLARYDQETDVSARRALLLTLGGYSLKQADEQQLTETLWRVYLDDPDPGAHAAAEWLLRRYHRLDSVKWLHTVTAQNEQSPMSRDAKNWYITTEGHTFSVLDVGQFSTGSPNDEEGRSTSEVLHEHTLTRRIAIAAHEVTREQWRTFVDNSAARVANGDHPDITRYSPTDDSPVLGVTWHEAALYCNWLSHREGIPESQWCFENLDHPVNLRMHPKKNCLELTGYRLPTEAEWEFACRAGSDTSRYYGASDQLLQHYAWFVRISDDHVHPVGSLKPNEFGLFDMLGNVFEWCIDKHMAVYSKENISDVSPLENEFLGPDARTLRAVRGGAANAVASSIRSAVRNRYVDSDRTMNVGFRPARTYPYSNSHAGP